jgi:conjugal transfer/type IV secretion protein DotA/TraY
MTDNIRKINAKSVAKYMFLPGIIPRARELGGSGFGYLAFLFATVYQAVRILPAGHPYGKPENIGKFTIRQAIAAAGNNLEFNRKNIDKIAIFFAILAGVVLLALQFILFVVMLFSGQAFAAAGGGDAPFKSIFRTEHPDNDIAFLLLDYTFGIPEFFGSHALSGGPSAFHEGLHALFQFYNLAILLVGVLIFLYYVFVVVVETAQTGVPFGNRFAKIYAPLRLIAAVGLLVPLPTPSSGEGGSSGAHFNTAQYLTLYAAKLGSSMATNGWILYNRELRNPLGVDNPSLVARANSPDVYGLIHFVSVYHACRQMYELYGNKDYLGKTKDTIEIKPYLIVDGRAEDFESYTYDQAKKHFGNTNVEVVLGEEDSAHTTHAGNVFPYCGRMTISFSNDNPGFYKNAGGGRGRSSETKGGVRHVEMEYYQMLRRLLRTDNVFAALGERSAYFYVTGREKRNSCHRSGDLKDERTCENIWFPPTENFQEDIDKVKSDISIAILQAYEDLQKNMDLKLNEELERRGWGGAGMWYNQIAQINGAFTAAIYSTPEVRKYPAAISHVIDEKAAQDTAIGETCRTFEPNLSDGRPVKFKANEERNIVAAMNDVYQYWSCEKADQSEEGLVSGMTGNVIIDVISMIFGINGLFELKANSVADEATGMPKVHPMASMSVVGKGLVENAIRSIGTSIIFNAFGGFLSGLGNSLGAALQTFSGMFVSIATIGLTAGFILYYILPFLPFLYFFFAVGSWVKSIFEAMVGAPLWALAHLKIDGDGFSGRAAAGGYFLILEIFLRPIATVFGLIGGMAIFAAMVTVLNSVFDIVVGNITGDTGGDVNDPAYNSMMQEFQRGVIDKFFFTIMYAILVYMIATSCFKMIDLVPKMVTRWLGSQVSTFNDNVSDPTQNLATYTSIAGNQMITPIVGGINQGIGGATGLAGGLMKEGMKPPPPAST